MECDADAVDDDDAEDVDDAAGADEDRRLNARRPKICDVNDATILLLLCRILQCYREFR